MARDNDKTIIGIDSKLSPNDLRVAVDQMKRTEREWIEMQQFAAKIQRAKYDACISEGFTAAEALELCKTLTI